MFTNLVKRFFALPKKKLAILSLVLLLVLAATGWGIYYLWTQNSDKNKGNFVTVDGQQYKVEDFTTRITAPPVNFVDSPETKAKSEEKALNDKIKLGRGNVPYQDYLALAQLYDIQGNTTKALANYKLAKERVEPGILQYDSIIKALDANIKRLEAK